MELHKIVLAIDSFKGSLSSLEAAASAAEAVREVFPSCATVQVGVADGGEGTVDALIGMMGGEAVRIEVCDPLMRPVMARYGIVDGGRTAVMEMASACGLPLLAADQRNPMLTSTFGLGELIADALERGCRKFLIGIGGSATNDGGCGMLCALGYKFLDAAGNKLDGTGGSLVRIAHIDDSRVNEKLCEAQFMVACDVANPLDGPQGAAYVFARQKGADDAMIAELDEGLRNLARVVEAFNGAQIAQFPGAGAAGGLGGGLKAFLGAQLMPGIEMVLDAIGFDALVADADLVITGEGRLDSQTGMGKAPAGIMKAARRHQVPTIAIGGAVEEYAALNRSGFVAAFPILPAPMSLAEAMRCEVARENVKNTVTQILRTIKMVEKA